MARDEDKTRDELLAELTALRAQVSLLMGWDQAATKTVAEAPLWDETLLRTMVEISPLAFYVVDHSADTVLYFNQRFGELWGLPDLETRREAGELAHSDVMTACRDRALDPTTFDTSFRAPQGQIGEEAQHDEVSLVDGRTIGRWMTRLPVPDSSDAVLYVYTFLDLTEYTLRLEQDSQAAKMAAVGQLTGGIAHDFNNFLTSIKGYATLASREAPADSLLQRDIEQVVKSANLGANLTHRLLAFSHHKVITTRALDLNQLIAPMETALRARLGEKIELQLILGKGLGKVKLDAARFELALTELLDNGREAMPEGGTLTVETTAATFDEQYVRQHPRTKAGPYIRVRVTDTGRGMSAEVKRHLFEPFFTTKGLGRGAGLGLATVYGVVEQHRGHIDVESVLGQGTSVSLYFPRVKVVTAEWPLNQSV
jgi:signal transduction histidine kinase